jgi:hypothetical protein
MWRLGYEQMGWKEMMNGNINLKNLSDLKVLKNTLGNFWMHGEARYIFEYPYITSYMYRYRV